MSIICDNLKHVREHIAEIADKCGRSNQVNLLAVSKTFPASDIAEAMTAGQICFGENRVQELSEKVPALPNTIEWHLIGQLQSNKAAKAVSLAGWIHSVDSVHLVQKISSAVLNQNRNINILLEINSGEDNKSGFRSHDELKSALELALECKNIRVAGLMTMAPLGAPDAELHRIFANLRALRDTLADEYKIALPELSMGMSGDYPQAIEEGATIVRIGTAIFGGR